jgi:hypothetical protein
VGRHADGTAEGAEQPMRRQARGVRDFTEVHTLVEPMVQELLGQPDGAVFLVQGRSCVRVRCVPFEQARGEGEPAFLATQR